MNDWQEVPAWQALKALTEGTHDVEWYHRLTDRWCIIEANRGIERDSRYRIRPKRRTVDMNGLPVAAVVRFHASTNWVELIYEKRSDAEEAARILEAAREAQ